MKISKIALCCLLTTSFCFASETSVQISNGGEDGGGASHYRINGGGGTGSGDFTPSKLNFGDGSGGGKLGGEGSGGFKILALGGEGDGFKIINRNFKDYTGGTEGGW